MYKLVNKHGKVVNMRSGEPFEYSTERLAKLGRKFLERKRKEKLHIVPSI